MAKSKRQRTAELLHELRPCRAGYLNDKWFELVKLLTPSNAKASAFLATCYGADHARQDIPPSIVKLARAMWRDKE